MWDDSNSWFSFTISEDPIVYGLIIILISLILLALRIYYKESVKMKQHSIDSWYSFVNSWFFIIGLFLLGFCLIFNNL